MEIWVKYIVKQRLTKSNCERKKLMKLGERQNENLRKKKFEKKLSTEFFK